MESWHRDVTAADLASIERAATDYIEAWLSADADRMADCLHPDLVKRSIEHDGASDHGSVDTMSHRDMVDATGRGGGRNHPQGYEVTIRDAFRNIATARVDSARYVDYLQIARFEDRWRIVNILWAPLTRA